MTSSGGAVAAGTAAVAAFASIAWVVNYFRGRRPLGAEQVDYLAGSVKGAAGNKSTLLSGSWN